MDKKAAIYRAIIPEKEATLQEMYLINEPKIKWIDERNHPKVIFLNALLSCLRVATLPQRAFKKIVFIIMKQLQQHPSELPQTPARKDELSY